MPDNKTCKDCGYFHQPLGFCSMRCKRDADRDCHNIEEPCEVKPDREACEDFKRKTEWRDCELLPEHH